MSRVSFGIPVRERAKRYGRWMSETPGPITPEQVARLVEKGFWTGYRSRMADEKRAKAKAGGAA